MNNPGKIAQIFLGEIQGGIILLEEKPLEPTLRHLSEFINLAGLVFSIPKRIFGIPSSIGN